MAGISPGSASPQYSANTKIGHYPFASRLDSLRSRQ